MTPTARIIAQHRLTEHGLVHDSKVGLNAEMLAVSLAALSKKIEDALLCDPEFMARARLMTVRAVQEALAGISEEHC
jgi:hypothetical protein